MSNKKTRDLFRDGFKIQDFQNTGEPVHVVANHLLRAALAEAQVVTGFYKTAEESAYGETWAEFSIQHFPDDTHRARLVAIETLEEGDT